VLGVLFALVALPALASEALWEKLKAGGYVILVRHASTEAGVGDPKGFKVDDCATQRNLNERGRKEAQRLGAEFKKRRIPIVKVMSSRWCRCLETARIAFDNAEQWAALDNTFDGPERREPQMKEIRGALARPATGGNIVLVTHGVNIGALTGLFPAPAELVVVEPGAKLNAVGRIAIGL
jgi:broad specificity phosphatase PhoE